MSRRLRDLAWAATAAVYGGWMRLADRREALRRRDARAAIGVPVDVDPEEDADAAADLGLTAVDLPVNRREWAEGYEWALASSTPTRPPLTPTLGWPQSDWWDGYGWAATHLDDPKVQADATRLRQQQRAAEIRDAARFNTPLPRR